MLENAGCAILVFANPEKTDVWVEDCSIALTLMQMEAQKLGLGSCWVQIRNRQAQGEQQSSNALVKALLNVPEQYDVLAILALGEPDEKKTPYQLDKLAYEKIHKEQF